MLSPASSDDSLSGTFYRLQKAAQSSGRSATEAESILSQLQQLQERVEQAALFSENEEADDISTASLKFLLVPYYSGLVESSFPGGLGDRLGHLTRALKSFDFFVKRMADYKLGDKAEIVAYQVASRKFAMKLAAPSASSAGPSRPQQGDPNATRTAKIARFKREKELTAQLEAMQQQRRQRITAGGSGRSNTVGSGQADEELLDEASDESQVREFYSLLFQSYLLTCVDQAKTAVDELDILLHHRDVELRKPKDQQLANLSPEERAKQMSQDPQSSKKPTMFKMTPDSLNQPIPANMKHMLVNLAVPPANSASSSSSSSSAATPNASSFIPSTVGNRIDALINSRVNARGETFKLTNQPTYSIEQWAEMEIAAGHMPGPNSNPQPKQPDPRRIRSAADREYAEELVEEFQRTQMEDGEGLGHEDGAAGAEQDDLKTIKDREWDNWKDDHQKGVGNTMK